MMEPMTIEAETTTRRMWAAATAAAAVAVAVCRLVREWVGLDVGVWVLVISSFFTPNIHLCTGGAGGGNTGGNNKDGAKANDQVDGTPLVCMEHDF